MKIVVVNNYKEEEKARQVAHDLTRCTGEQLEMLDYKTKKLGQIVMGKSPDAVILTGSNFMLSKSDTRIVFREEMQMVKELDLPFLGICFGHQLIGSAHGTEVSDLGQTIRAFKDVRLVGEHALFGGLPRTIRVSESHRQALTEVPSEFRHLAESSTALVEAIAHESRPIYGVQFHPERFDEKNPHGRVIIENFLRLATKV